MKDLRAEILAELSEEASRGGCDIPDSTRALYHGTAQALALVRIGDALERLATVAEHQTVPPLDLAMIERALLRCLDLSRAIAELDRWKGESRG